MIGITTLPKEIIDAMLNAGKWVIETLERLQGSNSVMFWVLAVLVFTAIVAWGIRGWRSKKSQ